MAPMNFCCIKGGWNLTRSKKRRFPAAVASALLDRKIVFPYLSATLALAFNEC